MQLGTAHLYSPSLAVPSTTSTTSKMSVGSRSDGSGTRRLAPPPHSSRFAGFATTDILGGSSRSNTMGVPSSSTSMDIDIDVKSIMEMANWNCQASTAGMGPSNGEQEHAQAKCSATANPQDQWQQEQEQQEQEQQSQGEREMMEAYVYMVDSAFMHPAMRQEAACHLAELCGQSHENCEIFLRVGVEEGFAP